LGLLAAAAAAAVLAGCGYRHVSSAPTVLPPDVRTIAITRLTNKTAQIPIQARLVAKFRDGVEGRGRLEFTDPDTADAEVHLTIKSYGVSSSLTGASEETLKFSARTTISARMVRRLDNSLIWSSGSVSVRESFYGGGEDAARDRALDLAVTRLLNRLYQAF
jgi:type IV pilus biogenesis protein CpaD/CtpE